MKTKGRRYYLRVTRKSLLLLPVAATLSETGISSLLPVSRHVAFRRDEHREVCPSFYAVHKSPRKIINGVAWRIACTPRARSKNIQPRFPCGNGWNDSRTLTEGDIWSLTAAVYSRGIFPAASVNLYSVRDSVLLENSNISKLNKFFIEKYLHDELQKQRK